VSVASRTHDPATPDAARSPWVPTLRPAVVTSVVEIAREAADRLRDHHIIARATAIASTQSAYPETIHWEPSTLAQGDAGVALTCAYLDGCFANEGWDRVGHRYLELAAADAERLGQMSPGMFGGLAGLAFAAWSLSRGATRYRRMLAAIEAVLLPQVVEQSALLARPDQEGVGFAEFDVISGLAGAGAYLLCRREDPGAAAGLDAALRALVALTCDADGRPRWWTPARLMGNQDTAELYPYGNLNCGLAHGIPGPIALMALALCNDVIVPGLEDALDRSAGWLVDHRADDAWGINWPAAVPLTAAGLPEPLGSVWPPCRTAWCYGAPGAARALWLAGVARDRAEWRNLAVEAMETVYRRPQRARAIDSPTFCHGLAGLLQITLRFAHDTRLAVFVEAAEGLTEAILAAFEPDSLLGYRSWEPGGGRVDQAGLLDGSPGVILTLLAAATNVAPAWDRAFLLS
jgi:hypothetical protein